MNILILNWKDIKHPQVGGAEIIVYELAKRFVKDGHVVTWFCRSFKGCQPEELVEGIRTVRRGNLLTTYLLAPFYYWSLSRKPDVVIDISNTIYWQTPLWAFQSKRIAYLNQLAKNVFFYEYPYGISRLGIFFERLQYLTYKHTQFVCYAESTRQDLAGMGIPVKHVQLFDLGVDHKRYVPGQKSRQPLFICVNRLVKMKRTDLVINAMADVVKKFPTARLVIVGTGYDRERLETLRNKLSLQQYVSFADEQTWFFSKNKKDIKVRLMQEAWALVFPSVKEGWGMTVTECAACATPAIVSNVSGLCDSVKAGKTGILISSNPPPIEISRAIKRIITSKSLRTRMSGEAYKQSLNYSWDKSFKEFKKIIRNL